MAGHTVAQAHGQGDWTVFATMSFVIAIVVAAGFGPTYTASLAPPGLPFWVHLHGAVMTGWIALFAVQPLHVALAASTPVVALVERVLPTGGVIRP